MECIQYDDYITASINVSIMVFILESSLDVFWTHSTATVTLPRYKHVSIYQVEHSCM
jgi:hypothetical protein